MKDETDMNLSLATDYRGDTGSPEAALREIAAAGFTHVHWCHHWSSDFLYDRAEIAQIKRWLAEMGLKLQDLHGSTGREKCWWSTVEYERLAGVELVRNRVAMTAELGGKSVVMHVPRSPAPEGANVGEYDAVRRSIDALTSDCRERDVRLAFENMRSDDFRFLHRLLDDFGEDVAGLCYDCGHGNIGESARGLDHLETLKHRLIAVHLHDNDGSADQHRIPFTGTVNFARLASILARSAYRGCVNLELILRNAPEAERQTFLSDALRAGRRFARMLAEAEGRTPQGRTGL